MILKALWVGRTGVSSFPATKNDRAIFSIAGQTKNLGNPISAKVHLYSKTNNQLIESINSDVNGFYKFGALKKSERFFIVSHHPQGKFNAVIQDNVVPK